MWLAYSLYVDSSIAVEKGVDMSKSSDDNWSRLSVVFEGIACVGRAEVDCLDEVFVGVELDSTGVFVNATWEGVPVEGCADFAGVDLTGVLLGRLMGIGFTLEPLYVEPRSLPLFPLSMLVDIASVGAVSTAWSPCAGSSGASMSIKFGISGSIVGLSRSFTPVMKPVAMSSRHSSSVGGRTTPRL